MNVVRNTARVSTATTQGQVKVRRTARPGDAAEIGELHRRVYVPEYGLNETFVQSVASGVERAAGDGWPQAGGGIWIVEHDGAVRGSLGLTPAGLGHTKPGERLGYVRWFALEPDLRGRGLGRQLIAELLDLAREQGLRRLELGTFSALTTAARIYRGVGFRVTGEHERSDWGPPLTFQYYALDL